MLEIGKIALDRQFFQAVPSDITSMFLALSGGSSAIPKLIATICAKQLTDMLYAQTMYTRGEAMNAQLQQSVCGILSTADPLTVARSEDDLKALSLCTINLTSATSRELKAIIWESQELVVRASNAIRGSKEVHPLSQTLDQHAMLLLIKYLWSVVSPYLDSQAPHSFLVDKVHTEQQSQKFGAMTLNVQTDALTYAQNNLLNLCRMGGTQFTFNRAQELLRSKATNDNLVQPQSIVPFAKQQLPDLLCAMRLRITDGVKTEDFPLIMHEIKEILDLLGLSDAVALNITPQEDVLSEFVRIIQILNERTHSDVALRTITTDGTLSINDYHLFANGTELLDVRSQVFSPGKVYLIDGVNGAGKSTLLRDIAGFSPKPITSRGTLTLPGVPIIFCGGESFNPPATTLFEKLTYRLKPATAVASKDAITARIKQLLELVYQSELADRLDEKGYLDKLGLSDGQKQLVTLIAAILYKESSASPVVLILDEAFKALDTLRTKPAVTKLIKEIFGDGVVLAVDHHAVDRDAKKMAGDFYDIWLQIADHHITEVTGFEHVAVVGDV